MVVLGLGLKTVLKTAAKTESFDSPVRIVLNFSSAYIFGAIWGMIIGEFVADVIFYYVAQGAKPVH